MRNRVLIGIIGLKSDCHEKCSLLVQIFTLIFGIIAKCLPTNYDKIYLHIIWIYVSVHKKYEVHTKYPSWIKNCLHIDL